MRWKRDIVLIESIFQHYDILGNLVLLAILKLGGEFSGVRAKIPWHGSVP